MTSAKVAILMGRDQGSLFLYITGRDGEGQGDKKIGHKQMGTKVKQQNKEMSTFEKVQYSTLFVVFSLKKKLNFV